MYTFHDLLTESIDKQQALHVQLNTIHYYVCGCFIIYSACNFAIPGTSIAGMRGRRPNSVKHLSLNHDHAHQLVE